MGSNNNMLRGENTLLKGKKSRRTPAMLVFASILLTRKSRNRGSTVPVLLTDDRSIRVAPVSYDTIRRDRV